MDIDWKSRIKYLFPPIKNIEDIKYDFEESLSYVTPYAQSKKINGIIQFIIKTYKYKNVTLLESCSGLGGNSIGFISNPSIKYIYSIELNRERYKNSINNVRLYKKHSPKKIEMINDNFIKYLLDNKEKKYTIIFIDPPWGGKDYESMIDEDIILEYDGKKYTTIDLFNLVRDKAKIIIFKVPINHKLLDNVSKEGYIYWKGKTKYIFII